MHHASVGSSPEPASVVGIRPDIALRPLQTEGVEDAGHHGVCLQSAIRIDSEPGCWAVINDAPTWEVLVLVPDDGAWQATGGQSGRAEAPPSLP